MMRLRRREKSEGREQAGSNAPASGAAKADAGAVDAARQRVLERKRAAVVLR